MDLKDKLRNELTGHLFDEKSEVDVNIANRITEKFSIDFADFINKGRFKMFGGSWIDPKNPGNEEIGWSFISSKELLELFKKTQNNE
jgi:hypothetical protein